MSMREETRELIVHADQFYIGGEWVRPCTPSLFDVVDSGSEQVFLRVAKAEAQDVSRAVTAARHAFDEGPWPRLSHSERAEYLRAFAEGLAKRTEELGQIWSRQSGVLYARSKSAGLDASSMFDYYAALANTFSFEEPAQPTKGGEFALIVREPVGVVGAIIPWNAPIFASYKVAPALLAGCTVIFKASPEAPGEAYIMAEIADEIGLPSGVFNFVTADREVSEDLVRDPRVDMISFTGSTAAGRRIASLCGERIARVTLELGGKSAAVILDDIDLSVAAATLARAEVFLTGQVCSSLTRIVVTRERHDELVEALTSMFSEIRVGDPFDVATQMGPLSTSRQRDRVENCIAKGISEGAVLAGGGSRPAHLERGWFVEPTVFAQVDNSSSIAQNEIFGPVLSVIPANDERHAIALANNTIYGLNASVFTNDVDRAREVAAQLRSGTVGHNNFRSDFGIATGGFKQSGIGREGGREGLFEFLETKTVILEGRPGLYA
jgi:aldehyde dehydrogenase (NAD+)